MSIDAFLQPHCVFCRIAKGQEPNKILYEVGNRPEDSVPHFSHLYWLRAPCSDKRYTSHAHLEKDCALITQHCPCVQWQDDEYIAFNDIRPAAKQHILVITKAHIDSILALKPCLEDVSLGKPLTWTAGCDGWTQLKLLAAAGLQCAETSKALQHVYKW